MKSFKLVVGLGLGIGLIAIAISCARQLSETSESFTSELPKVVDFSFHIKPILSDRCFTCHGPDPGQRKSNLRLDIEDLAFEKTTLSESKAKYIIRAGSSKRSEVFHRIMSDEEDYMMPPPDSHLSLSEYEKSLIKKWIDQGAEYKKHWSFIKPIKAKLLNVDNEEWTLNEIDHFI